jgi:hypothetical protein
MTRHVQLNVRSGGAAALGDRAADLPAGIREVKAACAPGSRRRAVPCARCSRSTAVPRVATLGTLYTALSSRGAAGAFAVTTGIQVLIAAAIAIGACPYRREASRT